MTSRKSNIYPTRKRDRQLVMMKCRYDIKVISYGFGGKFFIVSRE
jgi:hypothetical protein